MMLYLWSSLCLKLFFFFLLILWLILQWHNCMIINGLRTFMIIWFMLNAFKVLSSYFLSSSFHFVALKHAVFMLITSFWHWNYKSIWCRQIQHWWIIYRNICIQLFVNDIKFVVICFGNFRIYKKKKSLKATVLDLLNGIVFSIIHFVWIWP